MPLIAHILLLKTMQKNQDGNMIDVENFFFSSLACNYRNAFCQ